jgi:hypothetical protein
VVFQGPGELDILPLCIAVDLVCASLIQTELRILVSPCLLYGRGCAPGEGVWPGLLSSSREVEARALGSKRGAPLLQYAYSLL